MASATLDPSPAGRCCAVSRKACDRSSPSPPPSPLPLATPPRRTATTFGLAIATTMLGQGVLRAIRQHYWNSPIGFAPGGPRPFLSSSPPPPRSRSSRPPRQPPPARSLLARLALWHLPPSRKLARKHSAWPTQAVQVIPYPAHSPSSHSTLTLRHIPRRPAASPNTP